MDIPIGLWSIAARWFVGTMFPLQKESDIGGRRKVKTGNKGPEAVSLVYTTSNNNSLLPMAKPIFYDFASHDRSGWEVTPSGYIHSIPYATAANVDPPKGFPEIPETSDRFVQESAEGLYEVVNVLQALGPTPKIEKAYEASLRKMKDTFNELGRNKSLETAERKQTIIRICEDTTYELEALVGGMQVFGEKRLSDVYGVETIGIFITFSRYTFEQNYNLNLVMVRWMRKHWKQPYPVRDRDVKQLAFKYEFDSLAIETWLDNARTIVWEPLSNLDVVEEQDEATQKDLFGCSRKFGKQGWYLA
jgi:hypothetical protein